MTYLRLLCRKALDEVRFSVPLSGQLKYTTLQSSEGGVNMRVKVNMACQECKQRNYTTMKNKKNNAERIELSKYCPFCKKHTLHKETK